MNTTVKFYKTYGTQKVNQMIDHALNQGNSEAHIKAYPCKPAPPEFAERSWAYTDSYGTLEHTLDRVGDAASQRLGDRPVELDYEFITTPDGEEYAVIKIFWKEE